MKSPAGLLLSAIELDRASAIPLYRQLYLQIRKQILSGKMQGGVRLPSTRTLSKELALSRITILNAFDQLIAEGFLASRTGAGTYVGDEWERRAIADDEQQRQPPRLSDLSQSMLSLRSRSLSRRFLHRLGPRDPHLIPAQPQHLRRVPAGGVAALDEPAPAQADQGPARLRRTARATGLARGDCRVRL